MLPSGWFRSADSTASATPTSPAELKITKPALHYHFAGKAELGEALIARYAVRFAQALAAIDASVAAAPAKLDGYARLYFEVLRHRRMCLCGMLAAEYQTLPAAMQNAVIRFFDQNETWLQRVLEQGQREGSLQFAGSARDTARMIVSGLEGVTPVARPDAILHASRSRGEPSYQALPGECPGPRPPTLPVLHASRCGSAACAGRVPDRSPTRRHLGSASSKSGSGPATLRRRHGPPAGPGSTRCSGGCRGRTRHVVALARSITTRSASGKRAGSRLAAGKGSRTHSPGFIGQPRSTASPAPRGGPS